MIYVPMLKNRKEEKNVIKSMKECFSDKIIPLIEILVDKYEEKFKINPITNEFIYEQRGKQRRRVKEKPTDKDIVTLEAISKLLPNKQVFVDYFRFNSKRYGGNKIDINKVSLAWRLTNDEVLYKNRLKDIARFPNIIPVVSIKDGFDMKKADLKVFFEELQQTNNSVALRITEEWIKKYKDIIQTVLRNSDYLLFDISEQNPEVKFMEIEEIIELESKAKIVLINSPRKAALKNGEYETRGITEHINNCAREKAKEYRLYGYGDYCGLKDTLPTIGGSNGTGAALALLYDYNKNSFYSYMEPDTSQGVSGYKKLIPIILADRVILDSNGCPVFNMIESMEKDHVSGNWSTWHGINARRYIHQVYKNI